MSWKPKEPGDQNDVAKSQLHREGNSYKVTVQKQSKLYNGYCISQYTCTEKPILWEVQN